MSYSVALVFDKDNNWIYDFFKNIKFEFKNYSISKFFRADEVLGFDIVFLLGHTKILPSEFLQRNKLTLVVHASDLPKGKGFAPIQWQLLEGQNEIKVSLIEAAENVDSGDIFLQSIITFDGTELYKEIREKQAIATINIISEFY